MSAQKKQIHITILEVTLYLFDIQICGILKYKMSAQKKQNNRSISEVMVCRFRIQISECHIGRHGMSAWQSNLWYSEVKAKVQQECAEPPSIWCELARS